MRNQIWYKAFMAKFDVRGPSDISITIKVSEGMVRALDDLAALDHRKRSSVARLLMERGIEAFNRDGSLLEPKEELRALAPVVGEITSEKAERERIKREYFEDGTLRPTANQLVPVPLKGKVEDKKDAHQNAPKRKASGSR